MKGFILLCLSLLAIPSFASNVGISVHPLETEARILSTEYTGRLSNGSSQGLQVRYLHTYTSELNFDAGFQVSKEDISTLFAGATYEFYPDFENQPKIAARGFIERERNNDQNVTNFGIAPIVSKGYSFSGYPAYPYVSLPMRLSLVELGDDYIFRSSLAMGISGNLPFEGFTNVVGNVEANVNLKDSFSSLSVGLSMNFQ